MHLPDGYLSDPVCVVTSATGAAAIAIAMACAGRRRNEVSTARVATTAAGIFAAQMFNFTIDHGTSGHLVGATAAVVLLGPARAILAMGLVLAVQCSLFGDGGLSTLGANILNMAVVGSLASWAALAIVARLTRGGKNNVWGAGLAAALSILAAAAACSCEMAASGVVLLGEALPAMLRAHLALGASEALLTVAIVGLVAARSTAPADQPAGNRRSTSTTGRALRRGMALAAAIALAAPLGSQAPDGLERVAEHFGLARNPAAVLPSVIASDYLLPGVMWEPLAVSLAGLLGVSIVFGATCAICHVAHRTAACRAVSQSSQDSSPSSSSLS